VRIPVQGMTREDRTSRTTTVTLGRFNGVASNDAFGASLSWVTRSHDPRPVEGASEIDVILQNDALVVFASIACSIRLKV
jgi:hypothetical protein